MENRKEKAKKGQNMCWANSPSRVPLTFTRAGPSSTLHNLTLTSASLHTAD
jgi:hypothetical protein